MINGLLATNKESRLTESSVKPFQKCSLVGFKRLQFVNEQRKSMTVIYICIIYNDTTVI